MGLLLNSSTQSVGLFLDDNTLWAVCLDVPILGGTPKFKTSFRHELVHAPEDPTRRMHFYSDSVKLLFSKLNVKDAPIAMVFSDADTFVRYFEMPRIASADMRTAVNFEAQKTMPFPMKDLNFDFKTFPSRETKKQGVVFAAVRKDLVDIWRQALTVAGHSFDFAQPESMAFFKIMRHAAGRESSLGVRIYVGLRRGGLLTFVAADGPEILMSNLAKIPPPLAVVGQEPKKISGEAVGKQLLLLLGYFAKNFRGRKVQDMKIFADEGASEGDLDILLKSQIDIPIQKVAPEAFFAGSPADFSYGEMIALTVGAARVLPRLAIKKDPPLNIVTADFSKKTFFDANPMDWDQEMSGLKRIALVEAVILAVFFVALHIYLLGQVSASKSKLAQAEAQSASFQVPAKILSSQDPGTENAELMKKNSFLASVFGGRVYWTPKLSQVSALVTEGVALDVLEVSNQRGASSAPGQSLRLEGHLSRGAEDMAPLDDFVDGLKKSTVFTEGIGTVKLSKIRKLADADGRYLSLIFFIDSEPLDKTA